ncbi:MAG: hypothetical protein CME63_11390 [Halobacteriovoraceae bacterium]|nr:hypothetical protein [Halobacteriovoraceae bacterium]|tara:strand:- start:102923 stop:104287 length:1365 start_codon:yes stop_codon:yes gene_type:complete
MGIKISNSRLNLYLSLGLILTLFILIVVGRQVALSITTIEDVNEENIRKLNLSHQIIYLDEKLTHSAHMSALTRKSEWIELYHKQVLTLDNLFADLKRKMSLDKQGLELLAKVEKANALLVEMEERSIGHMAKGENSEAIQLLEGQFYHSQKKLYITFIKELMGVERLRRDEIYQLEKKRLLFYYGGFISFLLLLIIFWLGLLRKHIKKLSSYHYQKILLFHDIRMKKLCALLSDEIHKYVSLSQSSFQVIYNQLKEYRKLGWIDENRVENKDIEIHYEQFNQKSGETKLLLDKMRLIHRDDYKEFEATDVVECIDESRELLMERFDFSSIHIKISRPKERLFFYGHKDLFEQVIQEVLLNGLTSLKNEFSAKIEIKIELRDEKINIEISDTGEAIAKEARALIWQPFFTTRSEKFSLGIGLSLAKKILREMSGSIEYKVEKGSNTFIIQLPRM